MDRSSFDNQLFTWETWAEEGPLSMQFGNVELKAQVGPYQVGTKFPHAFILGDVSLLVLVDDNNEEHGFDLKLTAGEAVQPGEVSCDVECTHHHSDPNHTH